MSPETQLQLGAIIGGKYLVEETLGQGGFATVYRARHLVIRSHVVAVKVLRPEHAENPDLVERFSREALATGALHSRHTVRLLDYGLLDNGTPFMVTEYVRGRTIASLLRRDKRLRAADVVELTLGILSSLIEAHAYGIIHRDLKPENVYVVSELGDPRPVSKVIDFGIAKIVDGGEAEDQGLGPSSQTTGNIVFCTADYAAPEVLRGEPIPASDLYSLGILMLEMLEGVRPYHGPTPEVVASFQLENKPVPIGHYAARAPYVGALRRALEKDPARRFQSAELMYRALAAYSSQRSAEPARGDELTITIDEVVALPKALRAARSSVGFAPPPLASDPIPYDAVDDSVMIDPQMLEAAERLSSVDGAQFSDSSAALAQLARAVPERRKQQRQQIAGSVVPQQARIVEGLRVRVARDPGNPGHYIDLAHAFQRAGDEDAAFCALGVLRSLGQATASQRRLHELGKSTLDQRFARRLIQEDWEIIERPIRQRSLTRICGIVTACARDEIALVERGTLSIDHRSRIKDGRNWSMRPLFNLAAHAFRVDEPGFHVFADAPGVFTVATSANALIIPEALVRTQPSRSWMFTAGYSVSTLRQRFYLAAALPDTSVLNAWIDAAIRVARGEEFEEDDPRAPCIAGIHPEALAVLRHEVQKLDESETLVDVRSWRRNVGAAADRAGLLFCGDIAGAIKRIRDDKTPFCGRSPARRFAELVPFAVSDEYFALRRSLGRRIDTARASTGPVGR